MTKKCRIEKDLLADSIINDLGIACNNANCPWKGILSELDEHLKSCLFDTNKMPKHLQKLLDKANVNDYKTDFDPSAPEESCIHDYLDFNSNASLKARLYQKNPELIKKTFSSNEKEDKNKDKDIFEFLDDLGKSLIDLNIYNCD